MRKGAGFGGRPALGLRGRSRDEAEVGVTYVVDANLVLVGATEVSDRLAEELISVQRGRFLARGISVGAGGGEEILGPV